MATLRKGQRPCGHFASSSLFTASMTHVGVPVFLCQLGHAEFRRPVGVLTNIASLFDKLCRGWPILSQCDKDLKYRGPLPNHCPCVPQHNNNLRGVVADDFLLESSGGEYRFAILVFFILASVLEIPLSWHKTLGGDTLVWVGFELLLESYRVGSSQRRADWFIRWSTEVASSPTIHMKSFEEGLGRIMFVAGALEHERPFLGHLYKFLTLHPRNVVRRVPPYVSFILNFLSQSVSIDRHYDCNQFLDRSNVAPRVDVQASGTRIGIGGWFPYLDEKGSIDQWKSPWFTMEVTPEVFPWIRTWRQAGTSHLHSRSTRSVDGPETLLWQCPRGERYFGHTSPSFTDNRGNGSALNKLMSTSYPASAILMELSAFLKRRKLKALVEWTLCESNREKDALANGCADGFKPELEMKVDCENLQWSILPKALEVGRHAEEAYRAAKEGGHLPNRAKKERKKRLEKRLRTNFLFVCFVAPSSD